MINYSKKIMKLKLFLLVIFLFSTTILSAQEIGSCRDKSKTYQLNEIWVKGSGYGNEVCRCLANGQVHCLKHKVCTAWGDPHFISFDNKYFDFQGTCRYVLAQDCCDRRWIIESEHKAWTSTTSVVHKFTIRVGTIVVNLENPQILEVNGVGYTIYDDVYIHCRPSGGFIYCYLKQYNVMFRWNWIYFAQVFMYMPYLHRHNRVCGLCGNADGNANNDLSLTPLGQFQLSINQWGASWKTYDNQPTTCSPQSAPQTSSCNDSKIEEFRKTCTEIIRETLKECLARDIDHEAFIKNCILELCQCQLREDEGCECLAVKGYEQLCEQRGKRLSGAWKEKYGCQPCEDKETKVLYPNGFILKVGCKLWKCENGKFDKNHGKLEGCCTDKKTGIGYPNGAKWISGCWNMICVNGKLDAQEREECCSHENNLYLPGQKRPDSEKCNIVLCCKGEWKSHRCCRLADGAFKQPGEKWTNGCQHCICDYYGRTRCYTINPSCPCGLKLNKNCQCIYMNGETVNPGDPKEVPEIAERLN